MPTCERDERDEGTAGADDVLGTAVLRPRVTAQDVYPPFFFLAARFLGGRGKSAVALFISCLETVLGLQELRNFYQSILST